MPLPLDDRDAVIFAAHQFGCSVRLIARVLRIGRGTVRTAIARFEGIELVDPPDEVLEALETAEIAEPIVRSPNPPPAPRPV